jgi:hypothetical protein
MPGLVYPNLYCLGAVGMQDLKGLKVAYMCPDAANTHMDVAVDLVKVIRSVCDGLRCSLCTLCRSRTHPIHTQTYIHTYTHTHTHTHSNIYIYIYTQSLSLSRGLLPHVASDVQWKVVQISFSPGSGPTAFCVSSSMSDRMRECGERVQFFTRFQLREPLKSLLSSLGSVRCVSMPLPFPLHSLCVCVCSILHVCVVPQQRRVSYQGERSRPGSELCDGCGARFSGGQCCCGTSSPTLPLLW